MTDPDLLAFSYSPPLTPAQWLWLGAAVALAVVLAFVWVDLE